VLNRYLELVNIYAEVIFPDKSAFQFSSCSACGGNLVRFACCLKKRDLPWLKVPRQGSWCWTVMLLKTLS
jgi:hypothetical protein